MKIKPRNRAADAWCWVLSSCSSQPFLSGPAKAFCSAEVPGAIESLVLVIRAKLPKGLKEKEKKRRVI